MFVKIMPQITKFDKNYKPTDPRHSKNPWFRKMKITTPSYLTIKLLKNSNKKYILKAAGERTYYLKEQH